MPKTTKSRENFINILSGLKPEHREVLISAMEQNNPNLAPLHQSLPRAYKEFWQTHTGIHLGGKNSRNFEIKNTLTQEVFVLKLENRLGTQPLSDVSVDVQSYLSPKHFSQNIRTNPENPRDDRAFIITDKYNLDLSRYRDRMRVDEVLSAAVEIYPQMIDFFLALRKNEIIMSDCKNANFLLVINRDVNPPQYSIKVSDDKSLLKTTNGIYELSKGHFPTTEGYSPQVVGNAQTDYFHGYVAAINLYQFITGCPDNRLVDFGPDPEEQWNWTSPENKDGIELFDTPVGQELKSLIIKMAAKSPRKRISLTKAKQELERLNSALVQAAELAQKKSICNILYDDISKQRLMPIDPPMDAFCKNMPPMIQQADIVSINPLRDELDAIKEAVYSDEAQVVMNSIQDLRAGSRFYTIGKQGKADNISKAAAKLDLKDRSKALQDPGVQNALASHRHPFKKGDASENPASTYREILEKHKSVQTSSNEAEPPAKEPRC